MWEICGSEYMFLPPAQRIRKSTCRMARTKKISNLQTSPRRCKQLHESEWSVPASWFIHPKQESKTHRVAVAFSLIFAWITPKSNLQINTVWRTASLFGLHSNLTIQWHASKLGGWSTSSMRVSLSYITWVNWSHLLPGNQKNHSCLPKWLHKRQWLSHQLPWHHWPNARAACFNPAIQGIENPCVVIHRAFTWIYSLYIWHIKRFRILSI